MPFVTEELWQNLKKHGWPGNGSIMVAAYPEADKTAVDTAAEGEMEAIIEIIRSIRNARAQYRVENDRWIEARIYADSSLRQAVMPYAEAVRTLARANPVTFPEGGVGGKAGDNTLVLPMARATVVIPMASLYDLEAERQRIKKEMEQIQAEVARLENRLADQAFLAKAPAAVIEKERQKLYTLTDKLERLKEQNLKLGVENV
jgi:valyl-tRNA synthetase